MELNYNLYYLQELLFDWVYKTSCVRIVAKLPNNILSRFIKQIGTLFECASKLSRCVSFVTKKCKFPLISLRQRVKIVKDTFCYDFCRFHNTE